MNKAETMGLAREAAQGEPISSKLCNELTEAAWTPFFERFAAMVAAAKQEQCAKACEAFGKTLEIDVGENFSEEIRALKDGE